MEVHQDRLRCLARVITLYAMTLATFRHSDVIAFHLTSAV
jgi:hypothetical protein